jgi:hypothetical protein
MSVLTNVVRQLWGPNKKSARHTHQAVAVSVVIGAFRSSRIVRALECLANQDLEGRIQVLLALDAASDVQRREVEAKLRDVAHLLDVTTITLGYSTDSAGGGLYTAAPQGSLYSALSYLAKCPFVSYLSEYDWLAPNHLSSLLAACRGKAWAHSLRNFADPDSTTSLGTDKWESVGVGQGIYADRFGGWVSPSSLMLDKRACHELLPAWSHGLAASGWGSSHHLFRNLVRAYPIGGTTNQATVYSELDPADTLYATRRQWLSTPTQPPR